MLVLHGAWGVERNTGDAAFLLWAEDTALAADPSPRPEHGSADVPLHPLLGSNASLRAALTTLAEITGRAGAPVRSNGASWAVRLPTRAGAPLPSPEALGAGAISTGEDVGRLDEGEMLDGPAPTEPAVSLTTWQVRGRAVPASQAVWLLSLLPATDDPLAQQIVLGADARYWRSVAKLALDLVARERFVPTLEARGEPRARWRPVLIDPRDAARFVLLARAMPPACRAVGDATQSADVVLGRALGAAVDALVADGLAGAGTPHTANSVKPPSAADAWLWSLVNCVSAVPDGSYDLMAYAERVSEWAAPVGGMATARGLRTCFQLEPPPDDAKVTGDERVWTLRFLLQAADDPSLIVPAERVWDETGDALIAFSRKLELPQERLLTDLGRAARLFPPLETGLLGARPISCRLSTAEAYQFLREAVPLLEESGYGVLVPGWWTPRGARRLGIRVRLGSAPSSAGGDGHGTFTQTALVKFDWKLAIGDDELDPRELKRLARLKVPLVQVRGQWVEIDANRVEEAIKFWEKRRRSKGVSAAEALRVALAPTAESPGLPVVEVTAEGWLSDLLNRIGEGLPAVAPFDTPEGFVGVLREYQTRGAAWLTFLASHGLGGCLADDMGLGKTIQYIAFLLANRLPEEARRPSLLVCPTSVIGNWRRELRRFAPDVRVMTHHGPDRRLGKRLVEAVNGHDVVLSTYSLLDRDESTLKQVNWAGIVLDEAQNVKNPATRRARAVRTFSGGYRFAMTGTPVENRLSELWAIVDFLNPGYLGSREAFRRSFAVPIERWRDADRAAELRTLVRPFVLRRVKTDPNVIQDLPEKLESRVYCTLTREQASLYQAVVDEMLRQIDDAEGIERRGRVLAALLRLKQVCNHPASFLGDGDKRPLGGRSGKLARLEEMLEEVIDEGEAALVFTQFAEFGHRLREYLQVRLGREVLFLHGGTPVRARDQMVTRFQLPDGPPVFLLSLKAGGTGLNLTRATHVFHFDRWWNPAVEDQATDRAFRIGQARTVQVHKYICAGTLEERIDALIESKQALAEQVVGAGETWLTELSSAELRDLLALRSEAVLDD
ncbi:MAG TPA: DEAD/DEAH box helicase [Chloroflexota bacterium]|nr:DEAD/DEAH box helicase [Chloroflexota bacterium]